MTKSAVSCINAAYCNASYCSSKVQAELNRIKELITWNGFPKWIGRTLIAKKLKNVNTANNKNELTNENNENVDVIWINLPYLGMQGDKLLLSLKRKITRCLTKKVKLKVTQSAQKLCFYITIRDKINKLMKSYVAHQFCRPRCNSKYIGKTERTYVYD